LVNEADKNRLFENARSLGLGLSRPSDPDDRSFGAWVRESRSAIAELTPRVVDNIRKRGLPGPVATWRPLGFATFDLGYLPGTTTLAVAHVWPRGFRGGTIVQPALHKHRFELLSRNLLADGVYADQLFEVVRRGPASELAPDGAESRTRDERGRTVVVGKRFAIERADTQHRALADQGSANDDVWAEARTVGGVRRVPHLGWHAIPTTFFHAALQPIDELLVTLCARRVLPGERDEMIGNANFTPSRKAGRQMEPHHYEAISEQLLEGVTTQFDRAPSLTQE